MGRYEKFKLKPAKLKIGSLDGLVKRPTNPKAWKCALGIFDGDGVIGVSWTEQAKADLIAHTQNADMKFLKDVCWYIEHLQMHKNVGRLLEAFHEYDEVALWLYNVYSEHEEGWIASAQDLEDLAREQGLGYDVKTIRERCRALGLPLYSRPGRPKK